MGLEGFSEKGIKLSKEWKDVDSKFCKHGDHFCSVINITVNNYDFQGKYSFIAFMNDLKVKDSAFEMLTKLSNFFSKNTETNSNKMTTEMCKIMSRKIKEYIEIA